MLHAVQKWLCQHMLLAGGLRKLSLRHSSCVQVVRSMLWPSDQCPVYFTAGEDGCIRTWTAAGASDSAADGAAKRGAQAGAGRQRKRPRPGAV